MKNSGFTVVELLITLALGAILLFIGIPSFKETSSSSNMISSSNEMVGAFNYARMEAVKRGNTVFLGQRDGSSWTGGLVVWIDADADSSFDTGEELRLWEPLKSGSTVVSSNSRTSFVFKASGEVNNADVLKLCDDRSGEQGRQIEILISGAIFAEKVTCG
ncbi:GspH/FimT family pseudopilin [Psychromonas sp.]|uniref:GspH/FimT family pseudopilin n=1 Tax=Psychromonas sp. TaxID=1884585 RepID=UPI00356643A0